MHALDLYHHGSSVCAAKVRFALGEKSLEWQGHYLDILKGDQFAPDYLKLNPKAVVPTLVHDGNVIVESTVINEYIDETFPDVPLKPKSPVERAEMRVWTKAVDENLHPACGEITFASCHRHIVRRLPEDKFQAFLNSTPPISVTAHWHERKKEIVMQGLDAPGLGETFRLYDGYLGKMEDACRAAVARGRDLLARRHRGRPLRQPARHARHGADVGADAAARHRLVQAHQGAAGVQAGVPGLVPAGSHRRSADVRAAELAERREASGAGETHWTRPSGPLLREPARIRRRSHG